jgi:hypothetical protein
MASADSTRTAGGPGDPAPARLTTPARPARPLGAVIALSSTLAIALFTLIAPILHAIVPVTDLPDPLPDHHQDAETLLFVLAFAVLLPLGVWAGSRIADRISAGPNANSLPALAAVLTGLLALVLLAARVSSEAVLALGSLIWLAIAAALLLRAAGPQRTEAAARLAPLTARLWIGAAVLIAATALAFTTIDSVSWPLLIAGAVLIAAFVALGERIAVPAAGRRLGPLADVAVTVLLLGAVPNLVIFATGGGTADAVQTSIIQFHQDFFLGPANQILAGDAMLVDTLSQYGVGSIYFLAGLFTFIPIGNGTLGLIEGVLSALMFIGAWGVMRIAGVSRLLAASAMAVAVIALVYGLQYPLGGLLQHGAIRFGLPIGVVVGAVAESRWPGAATPARLLQLLTVAVASIWALEAFAYTALTVGAVVAVTVVMAPAGGRRRELIRWIAQLFAACAIAHVLLAAITLIATGELPDWGWYLNTLREFLFGQIGDLTYDFSPWSPGLAVGGLYVVSAAALSLLIWRRPDVAARERTMVIAIAGMTAFGVALFTYIVNRSADHIVPYVCLPAVAVGALWLSLLQHPALAVPNAARRAGWALGLGVSALLVAVAASSVDARFHESALAYARPGGASLSAALDRLWNPPPLRPAAGEGVQLLDTYMPGEERSSVLTSADLGVEILVRSERGSAVPLGDPWEDSFVPDDHLGPLGDYVAGLGAGDRILIDEPAREAFEVYRDDPERDPLETPAGGVTLIPSGLATLQEWVLREIGKSWDLKTVAKSPSGLEVVELVPREEN